MNKLNLIAILFSGLLLVACGGGGGNDSMEMLDDDMEMMDEDDNMEMMDEDEDDEIDPTRVLNTFDGKWSTGCDADALGLEFGEGILTEGNIGVAAGIGIFTISGLDLSVDIETYDNNACIGAPIEAISVPFDVTYAGEAVLSDCFNGEKVNLTPTFPITINGVSFSLNEFVEEFQGADDDVSLLELDSLTRFTLLCTNEESTALFLGADDVFTDLDGDGDVDDDDDDLLGTSDDTRPTNADLSEGLFRIE